MTAIKTTMHSTLCFRVKMATAVFVETLEGLQQMMRLKPESRYSHSGCENLRKINGLGVERIKYRFVGFEVLTALSMKMAVFWVVAQCSLVEVYQRFRGPCCLHPSIIRTSETLVNFYQTTRRYNPEDRHLQVPFSCSSDVIKIRTCSTRFNVDPYKFF
jgi:hypothetical protein